MNFLSVAIIQIQLNNLHKKGKKSLKYSKVKCSRKI